MPAHAVIELRDVDITVGGTTLVRRLSIDVAPGRVFAFVSERVDVRSAIVHVLSGNTKDTIVGGDLVLEGRELISRVGNATQAELHVAVVSGPLDAKTRVRDLASTSVLDAVGLASSDVRVHALSEQDRVRAAFAAALATAPKVVVVSVPYSAQASSPYAAYSDVLHRVARDTSIAFVVVTDSLAVAADVADEVMVTLDGRVVETGSVYDVCLRPAMPYVRDLVRLTPSPHRALPDFAGFVDLASHQGCPWVLNCREELLHACAQEQPKLRAVALGHAAACHLLGVTDGA